MKWIAGFMIVVIVILMVIIEWQKMSRQMKREKTAFIVLVISGVILAYLLLLFPDVPGPTQLIDAVYRPITNILKSWITER
ncbi:hypothetical protein [Ureibacillus endophyticus]|uniref:Uncharacterized protein n=1 Tax=Ureibacillus endophyticus TaxID=1978490 RepID=A0A494ZAC1_9BACL|nr:hypothetical protein [Lysinibacillus endophyticus]RKQ19321.1 hypothetical protein D8M03_02885 [Lysinibacillus endophyticus]